MTKGATALLIKRAQDGEAEALDELVNENTGLVRSVAIRFTGRGVEYEDLCQIGHIGMIRAIRNFDLTRGTAFSTYAVPLIVGEIKRRGALIMAEREKFLNLYNREPSVSEIARICNLSEEDAVESINAAGCLVSLSETVGEDGTLENLIGIDFTPEINERIALKQAIERLPFEEREIIYLRYFKNMTQSETGRVLGMTQVSVSRKEARALLRLKGELE